MCSDADFNLKPEIKNKKIGIAKTIGQVVEIFPLFSYNQTQ